MLVFVFVIGLSSAYYYDYYGYGYYDPYDGGFSKKFLVSFPLQNPLTLCLLLTRAT